LRHVIQEAIQVVKYLGGKLGFVLVQGDSPKVLPEQPPSRIKSSQLPTIPSVA
jgi:hypothetical protein